MRFIRSPARPTAGLFLGLVFCHFLTFDLPVHISGLTLNWYVFHKPMCINKKTVVTTQTEQETVQQQRVDVWPAWHDHIKWVWGSQTSAAPKFESLVPRNLDIGYYTSLFTTTTNNVSTFLTM